jgi:chemotaxis-related protein WspD
MSTRKLDVRPDHCWSVIGVGGDRSCPELAVHTHCRNCPVFTTSGRHLMDRAAPAGYIEEWTEFLAGARLRRAARVMAAAVFRLGDEWLAIDAASVAEVADVRPPHRIAHRTGGSLVGLVNIRGQLLLQVSLHTVLRIDKPSTPNPRIQPRLVVIAQGEESWAFHADEVLGVQRFSSGELGPVPVTVAHGMARVSKGLLTLGDRRVGYLDSEALFTMLRQGVA